MIRKLLTLVVSALMITACDSAPEPDDKGTVTEPEHVGDGDISNWESCINSSDCMSGYCSQILKACAPPPCEQDSRPDFDGDACLRDSDCEPEQECRRLPDQTNPEGFCTSIDTCAE